MMGSPISRELPMPLSRASMLKPFMSFLRGLGAPVAREILKAGLPQWGFEDYDVLVSTRAMTAFRDDLVGSRDLCFGRSCFSRPELVSRTYGHPTARRCRVPAL